MFRSAVLLIALGATGCTCETGALDDRVFACNTPEECLTGWSCLDGVCSQVTAASDGGLDAGLPDAGPSDAGPSDAGALDAGASDGGASDGGASDGGASDGGASDAGTPDAGSWWDPAFGLRRPITVSTGTAAIAAGYAVRISFDHAALVAASKSRADGEDLRIACSGSAGWAEVDRVLDTGSAFNSPSTTLWFKFPQSLAASGSDARCSLYFQKPIAAAAPSDPGKVFLFADDFESGTLSKWSINAGGGSYRSSSSQTHRGQFSAELPAENDFERQMVASPALSVADVYFESWWRLTSTVVDISQLVRSRTGSNYQTNLEGAAGWDIAKTIGATWSELAPNRGAPGTSAWVRVGVGIYGTRMRVFLDGAQLNPITGSLDVGAELASGNVGFSKWHVGPGSWWVDDAIARPWVDPEPTTSLGAEQTQ